VDLTKNSQDSHSSNAVCHVQCSFDGCVSWSRPLLEEISQRRSFDSFGSVKVRDRCSWFEWTLGERRVSRLCSKHQPRLDDNHLSISR
jgi:hypothetical protein